MGGNLAAMPGPLIGDADTHWITTHAWGDTKRSPNWRVPLLSSVSAAAVSETLSRRVIPGLIVASVALATPTFLHGAATLEPVLGANSAASLARSETPESVATLPEASLRVAPLITQTGDFGGVSDADILGLGVLENTLVSVDIQPSRIPAPAAAPALPLQPEAELAKPVAAPIPVFELGVEVLELEEPLEPIELAFIEPNAPDPIAASALELSDSLGMPDAAQAPAFVPPVPRATVIEPSAQEPVETFVLEVATLPEPPEADFLEPLALPLPPGLAVGVQVEPDLEPVASLAILKPASTSAAVTTAAPPATSRPAPTPEAAMVAPAPRAPVVIAETPPSPASRIDQLAKLAPLAPDARKEATREEPAFVPTLKGNSLTSRQALVGSGDFGLDITSSLTARIDGRAAGSLEFKQSLNSITVSLGSLMTFLKDRYDVSEYERLAQSSAKDTYLSLAQLREVGIPISYDPVYDEFNIGETDYRPEAAHKVQIEQIGKPERGVAPIRIDQIPR